MRKPDETGDDQLPSPLSLVDLETAIGVSAQQAIGAYNEAICVIRDHADEVYQLVEQSIEDVDSKMWGRIKEKGLERERLLGIAENKAKEATESVKKMQRNLSDPAVPGDDEIRNKAMRNTERVLTAIDEAKKMFQQERARVAVTDKYWSKVQEARRHFSEELETLFPNVRLNEKNMKLADSDIDLFVLYAFQNILFYQKELSKLDTISRLKLNDALNQSKMGDSRALETAVEAEMEKEKRKIGLEFQKRMLTLRAECERDMRLQLKRQAEAHQDHLMEALIMKEKEIERKLKRQMDEQVIVEKNKFKMQLASIIGRLKGIDEVLSKRVGQDKKAQQSQVLWSACQSLEASLRDVPSAVPAESQLRPLQNEVDAIAKSSAHDELVEAVVASIPVEALVRGVFTESVLKERFLRVEKVAHRVALLPEGGSSMLVMLLSYLQSVFIVNSPSPIPAYELANEPFEPSKFDTFDILQRARYWLDRGNMSQCLRYMNLLEGAPRAVASEWMREARIHLETKQAANALMAHASASGLIYS
ncbi:hypothetical protein AAG570_009760 [Ranatra chinensis]|uniref:MICOS complex subunit MIC60 n=1 Tax=Ranatra chinensis TaxID=642074 RepID=A0ABD0YQ00_9HEMI